MYLQKKIFFTRKKKAALAALILFMLLSMLFCLYYFLIVPVSSDYQKALSLLDNHSYIEARQIFDRLGSYKSSREKSNEIASYLYADQLIADQDYEAAIKHLNSIPRTVHVKERLAVIYDFALQFKAHHDYGAALSIFLRLKDYEESRKYANETIALIDRQDQTLLASGFKHFVSLSQDGSVLALGDNTMGQCNVDSWTNIDKIYAGGNYTIAIKKDGSITACGDIAPEAQSILGWTHMKELVLFPYPSLYKAVGLKDNGTVISTSSSAQTNAWTNIQHLTGSSGHLIGLRNSGTVLAYGLNDMGQCNVSHWQHITQVIAGNGYTLGLKDNGTVVLAGDTSCRADVTSWSDICYLWASDTITVGLKNDGSLIVSGPELDENILSSWKNICEICLNNQGIIGLQLNGSLVSIGMPDLSSFTDLTNIHTGTYQLGCVKKNGLLTAKELVPAPTAQELAASSEPKLGMSPDQVKKSSWGLPDKIISTIDAEGNHEQWLYGKNAIFFLNEAVISIQQEENPKKDQAEPSA